MQFAMEALIEAFEEATAIPCEAVVSSSGKLTAQIKEGAPFDVLVAADLKYPQDLVNAGLADAPARVYAYGQLVLWTQVEGLKPSMNMLTDAGIRHIALANPKTAPYGRAAMQVLDYYGLKAAVADKLVYGESIAQTNQFINTGAADLGFTAMAVVQSSVISGQGAWIPLPAESYDLIEQGVVVIKGEGERLIRARQFADFLLSPAAKEILDKFGYLSPDLRPQ